MRQLSDKEMGLLGLVKKDKELFYIDNMLIKLVDENCLSVTIVETKNVVMGDETVVVSEPIEYFKNGKGYEIVNQDGQILIFER